MSKSTTITRVSSFLSLLVACAAVAFGCSDRPLGDTKQDGKNPDLAGVGTPGVFTGGAPGGAGGADGGFGAGGASGQGGAPGTGGAGGAAGGFGAGDASGQGGTAGTGGAGGGTGGAGGFGA
jgi:hypothetical protein